MPVLLVFLGATEAPAAERCQLQTVTPSIRHPQWSCRTLSYDHLYDAVTGSAVGLRSQLELEPLGGPGDKIFPPTYSTPESAETQYAVEDRTLIGADGPETVVSAVLDSVASQANHLELALLDTVRSGSLTVPVTSVDFADRGLFGIDRISDYEAPHRIFDALLRDSFDGENLFRHGPTGRAITDATSRNATALFHHSPHTLVFGGWDRRVRGVAGVPSTSGR